MPRDAPWTAKHAVEWDRMTMKEFLEQNCWTAFARNVMTSLVRVVLAAETYEMSLLSFAWYIAAAQVNSTRRKPCTEYTFSKNIFNNVSRTLRNYQITQHFGERISVCGALHYARLGTDF